MKIIVKKTISNNNLKPLRINKKNPDFEIINGVLLRKDRAKSTVVVNYLGVVTAINGENPKNLEIGDNIYEI